MLLAKSNKFVYKFAMNSPLFPLSFCPQSLTHTLTHSVCVCRSPNIRKVNVTDQLTRQFKTCSIFILPSPTSPPSSSSSFFVCFHFDTFWLWTSDAHTSHTPKNELFHQIKWYYGMSHVSAACIGWRRKQYPNWLLSIDDDRNFEWFLRVNCVRMSPFTIQNEKQLLSAKEEMRVCACGLWRAVKSCCELGRE